MSDPTASLADQIASLSPAQRALFEQRLRRKGGQPSESEAIPRASDRASAPLSFAQQRLWFLDQLDPSNPFYNIARAYRVRGVLDPDALRRALEAVVTRHEALRTTFDVVDERPVARVVADPQVELQFVDLGRAGEPDRDQRVEDWIAAEGLRPFDLTRGPLLRAGLLRLAEREHVLLLTMHHIVSDGWSIGILMQELARFYEEFSGGRPAALPELPIQYADFARWQREWLSGEVLETQLAYWKKQLADLPVLQLPTDRSRLSQPGFRGARHRLDFPEQLTESLKELSRREGATLYMTLLAAFQVLLMRYTGQEDVVVGSPIANRTRGEIEGLIGFFVNTLVLRTDLSGDPSFRELLGRMREVALQAYAHQDLPFEKLVEELKPERHLTRNPLFQVIFALQNAPTKALEVPGLSWRGLAMQSRTTRFDLEVYLWESRGRLKGNFIYATDLFDAAKIRRMLGHYETLLRAIVANADQPISQLPLLTEPERQQLLVEWNRTGMDWPAEPPSVLRLFEIQVEKSPEACAIEWEGEKLTYRQLHSRSNQLARYLRGAGVGPDVRVGIHLPRSVDLVVGLLAVLKAGGAYVPIDPALPSERASFLGRDARIQVLLTQKGSRLSGIGSETVRIDLEKERTRIAHESPEDLPARAEAEDLAYVLYTSGSTGDPKGVAMEHRPLWNLILWQLQNWTPPGAARTVQFAPLSFDVSFQEIFSTFCSGGTLVLIPEQVRRDATALSGFLEEKRIERLFLPFVALQQLAEVWGGDVTPPGELREIITAGEQLQVTGEIARALGKLGGCVLHNHYGPTETHVVTASRWIGPPGRWPLFPPIGRPIPNAKIYLLDPEGQPVPIGVHGEIFIGGISVARGYLDRPDLTAERFLPDPFGGSGARLYRTGDVALYREDGAMDFLGRRDQQVKIRGYRVEPGEVEAALRRHPGVQECVVIARQDSGEMRLIGYIVPIEGEISHVELRRFLARTLPDYMIPSLFVSVESLPLTSSGKIDRRRLPVPEATSGGGLSPELPATATEKEVARIWAEVLKLSDLRPQDNFFELGGHSLLGTLVISRARHVFQKDLPLRMVFEHPLLADFAAAVDAYDPVGPPEAGDHIPRAPREPHRRKSQSHGAVADVPKR